MRRGEYAAAHWADVAFPLGLRAAAGTSSSAGRVTAGRSLVDSASATDPSRAIQYVIGTEQSLSAVRGTGRAAASGRRAEARPARLGAVRLLPVCESGSLPDAVQNALVGSGHSRVVPLAAAGDYALPHRVHSRRDLVTGVFEHAA